ncbi:LptF/LptG family permease [Vulgatibacter sp.]|uniref:LptF/LptG family permease n=1 Tax=Vulgatibacter sp. TaxID=1971226 RepID=UPI00356A6956
MFFEVVPPFLAALLFLTQLFFVARLLAQADVIFGSGVRLVDVGRILLFVLPSMLSYGMPIAFLLGILIGLGRLGDDREITALAATGHGPQALLATPLLLGAVLTAVMLAITTYVEPKGMLNARLLTSEMIKRNLAGNVKPGVFYEDLSDLTLFAGEVDQKTGALRSVLVEDARDPKQPILVLAPAGRLDARGPGGALTLELEGGELHRAQPRTDDYAMASFERARVAVVAGDEISRKNKMKRPGEHLTPPELLADADYWTARGKDVRDRYVEYHRRFAHPFVMLALSVVGVAVSGSASGRRKGGRAKAFAWTLGSVVAYFVLGKVFATLGSRGTLPAAIAAWAPVLLIAAMGVLLLEWKRRRGEAA